MSREFVIRCRVWGGRTGDRTALYKKDGRIVRFTDRLEAQSVADGLNKAFNSNPHQPATASYVVEDAPELRSIRTRIETVGTIRPMSFGALRELGLLDVRYEGTDMIWTVLAPIQFTDTRGNTWRQGDEIVWEK